MLPVMDRDEQLEFLARHIKDMSPVELNEMFERMAHSAPLGMQLTVQQLVDDAVVTMQRLLAEWN